MSEWWCRYRLGQPEFESSIGMLDRDIGAIEAALTKQQDEAASELRKLIRAAGAKMDAVRRRLTIAASPRRALCSFREVCANNEYSTARTVPRPALVAVGC